MRFLFYAALIAGVAVFGDISMAIFTAFAVVGMEIGREEEEFRRRSN